MKNKPEIIEGNKLIAEFMGDKIELRPYGDAMPSKMAWNYIRNDGQIVYLRLDNIKDDILHELWSLQASKMKYHSSWDWLMPVVEKIETLSTEDGRGVVNYVVSIDRHYGVVSVGGENEVAEYQGDSWIETVYNTVLEFIKWYTDRIL